MNPARPSRPALFLLAALLLLPAAARGETLRLSLEDAVRRALTGNFSYLASSYQPRIAATAVEGARGPFDPLLTTSVTGANARTPGALAGAGSNDLSTLDARAGVAALLPSGATASLTADTLWGHRETGGSSSSSAAPSLSASLRQPLLKGAGREVTEGGIRTARMDLDTTVASFQDQTLTLASQAITLYLAYARELLSVDTRRSSLDAARRLHAENGARVGAGLLASVELLESELAIAQREADLVDAERSRDTAADALRSFLGLPSSTEVAIDDVTASPLPEVPAEKEGTALFASLRPDVQSARRALATDEFRLRLARDGLLPSLDTVGEGTLAGLDRNGGEAWGDVAEGRYPAWSLSLQFSYPLGNRSARAAADSAAYAVRQARENLNATLQRAETELRAAYRLVESRRRAEEAQAKAVSVGETRVASLRKKLSLGLTTTRLLLDAETDLVQAEELLISARIAHRLARYEVLRYTGLLAERLSLYPLPTTAAAAEAK